MLIKRAPRARITHHNTSRSAIGGNVVSQSSMLRACAEMHMPSLATVSPKFIDSAANTNLESIR